MKVQLLQHNGETVGWRLVAETHEDKLRLGSIRNAQFFGLEDTSIVYAGRQGDDNHVEALSWQQRRFVPSRAEVEVPPLLKSQVIPFTLLLPN